MRLTARLLVPTLCLLLLAPVWAVELAAPTIEPVTLPAIWFDQLRGAAVLDETAGLTLVANLADGLTNRRLPMEVGLPQELLQDTEPRMVFASVGGPTGQTAVATGAGMGLLEAVQWAALNVMPSLEGVEPPLWVKLDIVQLTLPPMTANTVTPLPELDRSFQGLALDRRTGLAFLPEELVAATLVDSEGKLRPRNIARYVERRAPSMPVPDGLTDGDAFLVRPFTTRAYFHDGESAHALYRGSRLYYELSPASLARAARAGGDYLTRAVDPQGRFIYRYLPKEDRTPDDYNLVRHAGTVFSMAEMMAMHPNAELEAATGRALDYLMSLVVPYGPPERDMAVFVEDGKIKLGGLALAIVAVAQHHLATGDERYIPHAQRMARYLVDAQRPNGSFVSTRDHASGVASSFESRYYPGEAMLALAQLQRLDGDSRWLDVAERAAHYLIEERDGGLETHELIHDHWLLYALRDLHRARPKPLYLEHAFRITEAIRARQWRHSQFADYLGGFSHPPRGGPTATRAEGLLAAYTLALEVGNAKEAEANLDAGARAVAFILRTQFTPEKTLYLRDAPRALGGFHRTLTNYEVRIDYVQHALSGILMLQQAMEARGHERMVLWGAP